MRHDDDDSNLLLQFLHERDHPCPRCGYNLRNLTRPVCPECEEALRLNVGVQRFFVHWLVFALAPGLFSGIVCAIFVIMCALKNPPPAHDWEVWATMGFLLASAVTATAIWIQHRAFLKRSDGVQIAWAIVIWVVHIIVFGIVLSSA